MKLTSTTGSMSFNVKSTDDNLIVLTRSIVDTLLVGSGLKFDKEVLFDSGI